MGNAYASRNPALGYCQGMSDIAAVLVGVGLDEETVFRGLCYLIEDCCPGYHDDKLTGFQRDTAVLGVLIRRLLSDQIGRQLDSWGVPLNVLAMEHFVSLAAHTWQHSATVQMWDLLLIHGQAALFASFLALLELCFPFAPEVEGDASSASLRHGATFSAATIWNRWTGLISSVILLLR